MSIWEDIRIMWDAFECRAREHRDTQTDRDT